MTKNLPPKMLQQYYRNFSCILRVSVYVVFWKRIQIRKRILGCLIVSSTQAITLMKETDAKNRPYLPSCWNEESRMDSLFSSFRKKELNPTGWQDKMNFWIEAINKFSLSQKNAVISAGIICSAFERNKRYPACIDEVLNYMHNQHMIVTFHEHTSFSSSKSWLGWSYNLLFKYPVARGWSTIRDFFFDASLSEKFLVLHVLKGIANSIFERHCSLVLSHNADNVTFVDDLLKECNDICNEENLKYALMLLEQENKVQIVDEQGSVQIIARKVTSHWNNMEIAKFKESESGEIKFSEVDRVVLKLRKALKQNLQIINEFEIEQIRCCKEAKELANKGYKERAMLILKKIKHLKNRLVKQLSIQDNLETMLIQIQNTSSEKMVLDAYRAATSALKSSLSSNLALDEVYDTMEDIRQVVDESSEVSKVLAGDLYENDLQDVENELNELMTDTNGKSDGSLGPDPSKAAVNDACSHLFDSTSSNIPSRSSNSDANNTSHPMNPVQKTKKLSFPLT